MGHHPHRYTHLIHLVKIALTKIYKMKVASLVLSVTDTWVLPTRLNHFWEDFILLLPKFHIQPHLRLG